MANPINTDFTDEVIRTINSLRRLNQITPVWLGGSAGANGGVGGRPGGFQGQLTQRNVAYDTTEAATPITSGSSSLLDNLNHIRYDIVTLSGIISSGSGSSTFLGLVDVDPSSYSGQSGKVIAVNTGETGLEFIDVSSGSLTFIGLSDTPSTYSGEAGKYIRVNPTETGVEFVTASGIDGTVKASNTDTTARTLSEKIAIDYNISTFINYPGEDEQLYLSVPKIQNLILNNEFLDKDSSGFPIYWELIQGAYEYVAGIFFSVENDGTDDGIVEQDVSEILGEDFYRGRYFNFGITGIASDENSARIYIDDGVSTTYSSYISNIDSEFVYIEKTLDAAATKLIVGITCSSENPVTVTSSILTTDFIGLLNSALIAHSNDNKKILYVGEVDSSIPTPPEDRWAIAAKTDGVYVKNDTGNETGPLGSTDISALTMIWMGI